MQRGAGHSLAARLEHNDALAAVQHDAAEADHAAGVRGRLILPSPPSVEALGQRDRLGEADDARAQSEAPYGTEGADKALHLPVRHLYVIALARL